MHCDYQVTGRPTTHARIALTGQSDALTFFNPGGNLDGKPFAFGSILKRHGMLAAIDRRSRTGAAASAPAASAGSAGSKPTGAAPRPASTASGEEKPTAAEPKPR